MRTLVGWNEAEQADLVGLYLNVGDDAAEVHVGTEAFVAALEAACAERPFPFDVVLMALELDLGDEARTRGIVRTVGEHAPGCPVVIACRAEDVVKLAAYAKVGLPPYVFRDAGGDFLFLLKSTLELHVEAAEAGSEQLAAEQMRAEIESARRFQESVIPEKLPQVPRYELAGRYEPSEIRVSGTKKVRLAGGDYYDAWPMLLPGRLPFSRNECVGLLMADAAGHGMRACLSITALDAIMRFAGEASKRDPGAMLTRVNRWFCRQRVNLHGGSLVTMLYAVLDTKRHRLVWASAGHPMPLLDDPAGGVRPLAKSIGSEPLGVDPNSRYQSRQAFLPPGARVLIYTDGLCEASPPSRPELQFGIEGIGGVLAAHRDRDAAEALFETFVAAHLATDGAGRADDTSAILLTRKG
ncbi:MAG: PP2C family protein-serine/threonine phosphatase [Planctomycetota bacterium]